MKFENIKEKLSANSKHVLVSFKGPTRRTSRKDYDDTPDPGELTITLEISGIDTEFDVPVVFVEDFDLDPEP